VAAAYRVGDAELIDFLDAQRAFRDVRRAHSRALLDLRLSLSQLDAAVGVFPGGPLS
jgi:outer membrane protein TolC